MTQAQMNKRLTDLEKAVRELSAKLAAKPAADAATWLADAGCFKDDPVWKEMVELGRRYRRRQRPSAPRKKR